MEKRRLVSLVLALTLSTGLLAGCDKQTQAHVSGDPDTVVITDREAYLASNATEEEVLVVDDKTNRIDSFEEVPESKEYEAGEHLIMIRYDLLDELGYSNAESINSVSISIPEGYEILSIENFIGLGSKIGTGQTYGVDVWYINNEKVLVDPVYNEALKHYDYSQPGTVIELEEDNVLEDNGEMKLTK